MPVLKHRVGVGGYLWHLLQYIPVLNDLAVFEPKNIHHRDATVAGLPHEVVVLHHEIPFGDLPLEGNPQAGERLRKAAHQLNEGFHPIARPLRALSARCPASSPPVCDARGTSGPAPAATQQRSRRSSVADTGIHP